MAGPKSAHGVVLWQTADVSCTCRGFARGFVEIRLTAGAVTLDRKVFTDAETAARFAGGKMCTFNPEIGLFNWTHVVWDRLGIVAGMVATPRPAYSTLEELYDDTRRLYDSITANARRVKRKSAKPRRVTVKGTRRRSWIETQRIWTLPSAIDSTG
jgi:hypothetical protein